VQKTRGIVFPREGNPLWPLPLDYDDLTARGQRDARVNACRMQQTPELAVHAWSFFCRWYLAPRFDDDGSTLSNPGFYEVYAPPGPIHFQMIRWLEAYKRVGMAFPRGGAKSTTAYSYILFKLLTNEQWKCNTYVSKAIPFIIRLMDMVKTQIEFNREIVDDFGTLKPRRGVGSWSNSYVRLMNFSSLAAWSIDGKLRGPRADLNILDDVEQDPEGGKLPAAEEIEALKHKILRVLLPMLRFDSHMAVIGTLFHQRSFINHLLDNDKESPDYDERFASTSDGGTWHKVKFGWCDSKGNSLWPEVFTPEFVEERRRELGPAIFASEYENRPVSLEDCVFELTREKHSYSITDADDKLQSEPLLSDATVEWNEVSGTSNLTVHPRTAKYGELATSMVRAITIDPIRRASAASDFAAIAVGGMDTRNDLWLLDLFAAKKNNVDVCQVLWQLVLKWRPLVIGVEDTGFAEEYFHQSTQLNDWLLEELGYVPTLLPIKPPSNIDKGRRIRRLEWRYAWGKIKYPWHLQHTGAWPLLFDQTLRFTEDLANLKHDDCIDAVEMLQTVFKGRKAVALPGPSVETPADLFVEGERYHDQSDMPLLYPSDLGHLSPEQGRRVLATARDDFFRLRDESDSETDHEYESLFDESLTL
jgi:hypothetical protein